MKIALLHEAVPASAPPDAQDTLVQADAIAAALERLGYTVDRVSTDGDLAQLRAKLVGLQPCLVFNLVESLAGSDAAAAAVPALLDGLGLPYTGSSTVAIALANDKCAAKVRLASLGLPTPEWVSDDAMQHPFRPGRYLIKCRFEHASVGLDEGALAELHDEAHARRTVREAAHARGRPCFAERFVDGREFNLSVLADGGPFRVLPPAEIDFSRFPAGKPRLVGYRAKWDDESFEYRHTPRCFDFDATDEPLLENLCGLALRAVGALGLAGYARVDFRVDADRACWILEVNANPCLTPDAGFAAALERAGLDYDEAIRRIVASATPLGVERARRE